MARIEFRRASRFFLAFVGVLFFMWGCGQRTSQRSASAPAAGKAEIPLPEWAPKDPSPEFLRAARVLKPMPPEVFAKGDAPAETRQAILALKKRIDPLCWELFGTLSDKQIEKFLTTKRVELRVRELNSKELALLNAVLDGYKGFRIGTEEFDWRVMLYKGGATQDLSNVSIGFRVMEGRIVGFFARVQGKEGENTYGGLAQL